MTGVATYLLLCSLLSVALVWVLPRRHRLDAVAVLTVLAVGLISPLSALWLAATALVVVGVVRHVRTDRYRGWVVLGLSAVLVGLLFASRNVPGVFWIGGAYFTLRHIHVLIEWWMGRLETPTVAGYLRYSLFLPVIMAGPIHRIENFQRQERRQALSPENLFAGAERMLFGLAQAVIVASWGLRRVRDWSLDAATDWHPFMARWLEGAIDWLQLYFNFAGLTSVALGLAWMMGLRLEENFNRPWMSRHLIDFWQRWHMTLSHWCRDYVFYPVTAITRLPLVALLLAMLAMGLWHDDSAYYVLWAVWQSIGIFLTHVILRLPLGFVPGRLRRIAGTLSVFAWLSLTKPAVLAVLDYFPA